MGTRYGYRNGILTFFDSATHERVLPLAPRSQFDDFEGAALDANLWEYALTANADTQALDTLGHAVFTVPAENLNEEAGVFAKASALAWDVDKGLIIEFRAKLTTLPTVTVEGHIGILGEAWVADKQICAADDYALHAVFSFDGSGTCTINTDDGTNEGTQVATGLVLTNAAYHIFRIDFTTPGEVLFYCDGVRLAPATVFMMDDLVSSLVQPLVLLTKSAGDAVGVGVITLDYIKIWQATR